MSPSHPPRLSALQRTDARQRATLVARLQTVQLLQMSERGIAELVRQIESDPYFEKLIYPPDRSWKILKFQPHPRTRLQSSFYEMNEQTLPGGTGSEAATLLAEGREALALIRKIGQDDFERHFLRAEEEIDEARLAARLGITVPDIRVVRAFLLAYSVQAEFFDPSLRTPPAGPRVVRLATVSLDEAGEAFFEFGSPLLARGRYDIHYDRLQALLRSSALSPGDRRHLKAFIRRLELINWRQNTLYRILDFVCHAQRRFLADRDGLKKIPITQRQLARRLAVAPSTINRAIQDRSLVMPWGEEVLLEEMFCSRKTLCVETLEALEAEDDNFQRRTDQELQAHLQARLGLPVPRRTVNSYRRVLSRRRGDAHAA